MLSVRQIIVLICEKIIQCVRPLVAEHDSPQHIDTPIPERDAPEHGHNTPPPVLRAELQIPPAVIEHYEAHKHDNDVRENERSRVDRNRYRVEIATLVFAILGFAVLFVTLKVALMGVEATRRSVEISQRAWLIAGEFARFKVLPGKEDEKITIPLVVENSGETPAIYVQGRTAIQCTDNPQKPLDWSRIAPRLKTIEIPQATIGPRQKSGVVAKDLSLPQGCQMEQVLTGQISLLTYGYVLYWDEFGTPRGLLVCGVYMPNENRFDFCGHDNIPW